MSNSDPEFRIPEIPSDEPTLRQRFENFQPATFIAWVSGKVTHDAKGGITFSLHVPFKYRHAAEGIWDANNVPLVVRVERWVPNG